MPQSLARIVLHLAFSTKKRVPFLKDPAIRERLHAYMAGVLQNIGCEPILINGVEDHVHILCNFSRTITVASLVEEVKRDSSKWVKDQEPSYHDFFWQSGYGVFSVSESNVERVRAYVAGRRNIIARFRSRTNSGRFAASMAWRSMNDTFGIEWAVGFVPPRWGLGRFWHASQGVALGWLG